MFYVQNISIYMNNGEVGGDVHFPPCIFVYYSKKNEKVQEHDLYWNQILHHFDLNNFFLGLIIKKLRKGSPEILIKGGARRRCNWAKMSRVAPCDTPTLCGQSACLWGKNGLGARNIFYFFIFHSFHNIYLFILQIYTPPPVLIIEWWDKLHSIQE